MVQKKKKYLRLGRNIALIVLIVVFSYIFLYPRFVLWQVETYLGTSIPDEAFDIHYSVVSWQGSTTFLRFSIPPNNMEDFLRETCFKSQSSLEEDYQMRSKDYDWWLTGQETNTLGGECSNDGVYYSILIQQSPEYTIYLVMNTT